MRLVQLSVPSGKRDVVRRTLEEHDHDLDYVFTEATGDQDYETIVYIPLPKNAVEAVLTELRNVGVEEDAITVVVEANTIVSKHFDQLQEEYTVDEDEDRIAREEITATANSLMPAFPQYVVLTIISAVVATAGLLLDSPAVVIGSMVIAPLVGPALAASVGTVTDDTELRSQGVILQVLGVVGAVGAATVFAGFVQVTNIVPPGIDVLEITQIRERFAPDFLSLAIAIGAGIAGALSLTAGVSTALVGVMIAAALIPPAAAAGIGLAWGEYTLAMGSAILVAVNILSINLVALLILWYQGYRPERWLDEPDARTATRLRVGVLLFAILILSGFLAGVTFASYQSAVQEQEIRDAAADVVAENSVILLDIEVYTADHPLRSDVTRVVLTVGTTDEPPPDLVSEFSSRLSELDDTDLEIQIRYIDIQTGTI